MSLALKRLCRRKGATKWTDKLCHLIGANWGEDGSEATVPVAKIWRVLLSCDSQGKKHLAERAKAARSKARRKEKKTCKTEKADLKS